ncbi:TetR family transcriptional regulator [Calothrix parasitica NIES-267]|uniref:TetR family transcriptional regulator n=1 Tax=Calothrix parasitica NIES-267 TaxID=1973488 RepID=A0A1Z4LHU1_9CYAN|nr:TetR family transcriptional regulator [Calothrix parasitica NIES-267]
MNDSQETKKKAILKASFTTFLQYGFRRTSMEDIASSVGISRAALYLHFKNKQEIFRSLSQDLQNEGLNRAQIALNQKNSLEQCLVEAFESRYLVEFFDSIYTSAHGEEIIDINNSIAADISLAAQTKFEEMLIESLEEAEAEKKISLQKAGLKINEAAELLMLAANGLKIPPPSADIFRIRLKNLIRLFVEAVKSESN